MKRHKQRGSSFMCLNRSGPVNRDIDVIETRNVQTPLPDRDAIPDYLLKITCGCGNELKIVGNNWKIDFANDNNVPTFTCSCGQKHKLGKIML